MDKVISYFIYASLWVLVLGVDCPYQECFCTYRVIWCHMKHLKEIPQKVHNNSEFKGSILFDINDITIIPNNSLPSHLTGISLYDVPIQTIEVSAFDQSLNTMTTVIFSGARFTEIPKAVFRLKALKRFEVSETNILVWNNDGMKHLGSTAHTLKLNAVGLTTWPSWMQWYHGVTDLSISGNPITSIPDDALDHLAQTLKTLKLENNNLTAIPKALSNMTALESLSLQQNDIIDIAWLPQLCNLSSLSLSHNQISDVALLSSLLRVHGDTLRTFDIRSNHLPSIPEMPYLTRLVALEFSDNHISDPNSGSLRNDLSMLKLDNNYLPSIPSIMKTVIHINGWVITSNRITAITATDFLNTTTGLALGYNLITELTNESFPENCSITNLDLDYNPLSLISLTALQNLPRLTRLSLRGTYITRLPLGIASLTKLQAIDFSDNVNLVCTCLEKSLESKIRSLWNFNVMGKCGDTFIFTFFTQLSKNCPTLDDL